MTYIFPLLLFAALVMFFLRKKGFKGDQKVDYSYGEQRLQYIKQLIVNQEFAKAELQLMELNSDDLSQAIDYICLNGNEDQLQLWADTNPRSDLAPLCLGVFHLHQAWVKRGYDLADNTSMEQGISFIEHLDLANRLVSHIPENKLLQAEAYSRLIRISMGRSDIKSARSFFRKCIAINPNHLWAHLHYAETIQPKWGGNKQWIKIFLDNLTEVPLVNQIVHLKLAWDSILMQTNLFGKDFKEIKTISKNLIYQINAEIENDAPTSIHRFILYNYLTVLSEEVNDRKMNRKYNALMDGKFTLYPFGIMN